MNGSGDRGRDAFQAFVSIALLTVHDAHTKFQPWLEDSFSDLRAAPEFREKREQDQHREAE